MWKGVCLYKTQDMELCVRLEKFQILKNNSKNVVDKQLLNDIIERYE